ncbi:DNA polymerase [Arsenicicoccus piscis]|uniref:DNA polymerase n=1 Tax=Arsenicicoccus piscis TaxID=673954 RepID=UPI001F4CA811|nr:DNA polymerase [Arsenicicoccus piscis]
MLDIPATTSGITAPRAPSTLADAVVALELPTGLLVVDGSDGRVLLAPTHDGAADLLRRLELERRPRWVWWDAGTDARRVLATVPVARAWDVAEAHRLLVGGWSARPGEAYATAHGLDPAAAPVEEPDDLFAMALRPAAGSGAADGSDPDPLVTPAGHLRADARTWAGSPDDGWARGRRLAQAALETAQRQQQRLADRTPRAVVTATSESAAAVLCVEMEQHGLPIDRAALESLIEASAGPRPATEADAARGRRERDQPVLRLVPGAEHTDLRNPVQVRALLASVGIDVPDTRKWTLTPYRDKHPVVEALLGWRKAERIATTYGWHWLATYVETDDRLRGPWTACDGGAGRMTGGNGLHNLPAELRPAVAAHEGHVLVRADLGQIEPRVLAAVSGDAAFAAASRADDLYAPVADQLRVDRPVAKVAVLAAMYGQTSGAAGEALRRLDRTYPDAMAYLHRAYEAGLRGDAVQTFGGRRVPMWQGPLTDAQRAGRGRFARNAVIQGAAAELFKAWAATVRLELARLDGQIVLCLHDELLLHVPREHAEQAVALVHDTLGAASRRWTGGSTVRFVADVTTVHRWSEAK